MLLTHQHGFFNYTQTFLSKLRVLKVEASMAQLESAGTAGIPSSQQQQVPSTLPSLNMEVHDLSQPVATQGKQATVHDFMSLCGTGANSTSVVTVANNGSPFLGGFVTCFSVAGSQQSVTTQDLLQPLQKSLNPGSSNSNLLPNGFILNASKPYGSGDPSAGQQSNYTFGNGSFELRENFPSKYRSSNISFGAKGQLPHAIPLNKHWQQQQQPGLEVLDGNKRVTRIPSEEDEDEDDESFDHGYSARKGSPYQKSDSMQQLEGRNVDNKGATPRSKHSATEQRRRSKINDRFQMLRQLLPNADQKRDKASFLLEVIEYIQMLHEKVKKYEGAEYRGPHQERTKVLSWDRNVGQQDVAYVATHDTKDVPDTNGFIRSRLSPLRVMSEDGITTPELMCSMVQASALHSAPAYLPNYESKPLISKPIPLTFSQPPAITTLEQLPNPVYQSMMPEGQTMFGQLLRQEEQAAMKARSLLPNKADIIPSHLQQGRSLSITQESNPVDQNFQKSRSIEQNLAILNFRRSDDEVEGRTRFSQMTDVSSTSKDSGKDVNKLTHGFDGKGVHGVTEVPNAEQRSEVSINEQEAPAVLGGVINISSVYSQGLLDTLTRALQSSGVDMAQATISVQIDLGKPEGSVLPSSKQRAPLQTGSLPFQNKETVSSQESEHAKKRPKIEAD